MGSGQSRSRVEPSNGTTIAASNILTESSREVEEIRTRSAESTARMREEMQKLKADNSALHSANTGLEGATTRMRDEVESLKAETSRLQTENSLEVTKLKAVNTALQSTNAGCEEAMTRMRGEAESLKAEILRLQSEHSLEVQKWKEINSALQSTNSGSDGAAARMRDEVEALKTEISRLQSENSAMKDSISQSLAKNQSSGQQSARNPDMHVDKGTILKRLISQVETGFLRRNKEHVESVFGSFSCAGVGQSGAENVRVLKREQLSDAFAALGVVVSEENGGVDTILKAVDLKHDGLLEMEEFKRLIQLPVPHIEWIRGLPLAELMWDAMPREKDIDLLQVVANMTPDTFECVASAFKHGLINLLAQQCLIAKAACEVKSAENPAASKFQVTALNSGAIADFHSGIVNRIGQPSLRFDAAMESEHCHKAGSNFEFTTGNYNVTTTPAGEWAVTVLSEFSKADTRHDRKLVPIEDLMTLNVVTESSLMKCEVIAVVLYTGPMYVVFNAILRRFPEGIYKVFSEGDNLFTTTINVLVSSVQKVSRTVKLPEGVKLMRGLGGTNDLPPSFYKTDAQGCRGFAEWGFMSTTSSKETAMLYSGARDGRPRAMVLEADTGAVSRGACIRDMSQYPGEIEYLMPPWSFVEPAGAPRLEVTPHGPVTVVPVKLFPNIKTLTLEGLLAQKKDTHLAAFRFVIGQIREDIEDIAKKGNLGARIAKDPHRQYDGVTYTEEFFAKNILEQCEEFLIRHKSRKPDEFTEDEAFRGMVVEMLDVKTMAMAKLQYYIADKSAIIVYVHDMSLREAYRAMLAFSRRTLPAGVEERKKAAREMCRLEGLMHEGVNDLGEPRIVSAAAEGLSGTRLRLLLAAGAKISDADPKGNTAMHLASRYGHTETLQALISEEADVDALNQAKESSVFLAAGNGHTEAVQMLVSANATVTTKNQNGWTALTAAAEGGRLEASKVLLEAKADIESKADTGATPLFMAAQNGHVECVRALVDGKAAVDAALPVGVIDDGSTPLFIAAQNGHVECVRALVDGVTMLKNGCTALFVADKCGLGRLSLKNDGGCGTPLCMAAMDGHVECVRALLENKADVDAADKKGWRPLSLAADDGYTECVRLLLQYRADVNAKHLNGKTALDRATSKGHTECATMLRAAGGT